MSDEIKGAIERITYYNEDNGYSVIRVYPEQSYPDAEDLEGLVTVVGIMPEVVVGESAKFAGKWVNDARYGKQFKADTVIPILPGSPEGIIKYLSSGIVRGIGPRTAEKIVDYFGAETLDVLDNAPHRIREVPRLKPQLAENLMEVWTTNRSKRQTMIYLQGFGITARFAQRIYDEYGRETLQIVQEDPYRLAEDMFGIGFKKADAVAMGMGVDPNSPNRMRAGLVFALNHLSNEGHTFAPRELLVETTAELLEVQDTIRLHAVLQAQIVANRLKEQILVQEDDTQIQAVYLPVFYHSEAGSAERLRRLSNTPSKILNQMKGTDWQAYLRELSEKNQVELTEQQQGAVQAALTSKLSVLTGGPGTGKTTTLQMVIHALEQEGYRFALASPTGRAAKRLSEATQRNASTIHRLLAYSPYDGFLYDQENPLEIDMLVVDEASMLDLVLFYNLLKALKPTSHLMLVGDIDQLPSVGAGNVLRDIIDSDIAHVTRLEQIFRQDDDSHIVVNAHRINQGDIPYTNNKSKDFFFFSVTDPESAGEMVVDVVANRLPEKFGFDAMNDIQVLAPMYRGLIGVTALNHALQERLNGNRRAAEHRLAGITFRVGDKLMQTKNNYDKEVFNGDIGRLRAIDFDENILEVVIDGRFVQYDFSHADELIHAYCISTHRSQGSEYPVVVMPLLKQHYMMLQRNLVYTAITRAKQMVVLVGDRQALFMAVNNNKVAERYSGLADRLRMWK